MSRAQGPLQGIDYTVVGSQSVYRVLPGVWGEPPAVPNSQQCTQVCVGHYRAQPLGDEWGNDNLGAQSGCVGTEGWVGVGQAIRPCGFQDSDPMGKGESESAAQKEETCHRDSRWGRTSQRSSHLEASVGTKPDAIRFVRGKAAMWRTHIVCPHR